MKKEDERRLAELKSRLSKALGDFDIRYDVSTDATEEEIRRSWEASFTDPEKHNPKNFCYLVHSLSGIPERLKEKTAIWQRHIWDNTKPPPPSGMDLSTHPLRIAEKKIISASVINQDYRETFRDTGLIIKAPFENILRVAAEDLGIINYGDPDKILAGLTAGKRKLSTVDELIVQSEMHNHEVVLTGTTNAGKVEVIGFWRKVLKNGKPLNSEMARQVGLLSKSLNLPLVPIVQN